MILKTYAEFFMDSSKENIVYYNKLAMTKKPCKLIGNIK
jgi:hypothetical protein